PYGKFNIEEFCREIKKILVNRGKLSRDGSISRILRRIKNDGDINYKVIDDKRALWEKKKLVPTGEFDF
ncbi:unnamed protein product, partial [marine sediment metagenome]